MLSNMHLEVQTTERIIIMMALETMFVIKIEALEHLICVAGQGVAIGIKVTK